jgi:hypothetical protein
MLPTPLQETTIPVSVTGQAFERNERSVYCGGAPTGRSYFNYSVVLGTPFVAAPATTYWQSVQATTPSFQVYWMWRDGTLFNQSSLQLFGGQFILIPNPVDRALALTP